MWYNNILETIGNTPLVKLNTITKDIPATVLAKIETTNPGNSIKDRMALKMIEDAEKDGRLKPGGTIIEGTSGNTGMGLAIAAVIKGYKCIFTSTDKQSKEKFDALRAFGAEVIGHLYDLFVRLFFQVRGAASGFFIGDVGFGSALDVGDAHLFELAIARVNGYGGDA